MGIFCFVLIMAAFNPCYDEPCEQDKHRCELWMKYINEAETVRLPISTPAMDQYVYYRSANYSPKEARGAVWKWINDYAPNHFVMNSKEYCLSVGQPNDECWTNFALITRYIGMYYLYERGKK